MSNVTIKATAGDHHHLALAKHYIKSSLSSEAILDELKGNHYHVVLNGSTVQVNAISILGLVNGYRLALSDIQTSLANGTHKYTKAKGLHRVAKANTTKPTVKPVAVEVDEDEAPF